MRVKTRKRNAASAIAKSRFSVLFTDLSVDSLGKRYFLVLFDFFAAYSLAADVSCMRSAINSADIFNSDYSGDNC